MCISCKTPPSSQHICSFGLKLLAVFTKCHTNFELVPSVEFTVALIKAVNSFYKLFLEVLKHLPLTKVVLKITTVAIDSKIIFDTVRKVLKNAAVLMTFYYLPKSITLRRAIKNIIFSVTIYAKNY